MKFLNTFLVFVSVLKVAIALKANENCLNADDIALIFDGKPRPRVINRILNVLHDEKIKAKLIINGIDEYNILAEKINKREENNNEDSDPEEETESPILEDSLEEEETEDITDNGEDSDDYNQNVPEESNDEAENNNGSNSGSNSGNINGNDSGKSNSGSGSDKTSPDNNSDVEDNNSGAFMIKPVYSTILVISIAMLFAF